MSLDLNYIGNFGAGNDIFNADNADKFNSYAQVTQIEENSIIISTTNYIAGAYHTFNVNDEIMIHVSALKSGSNSTQLGTYFIAKISATNTNSESNSKELTLNKKPTDYFNPDILSYYHIQAITIPSFKDFSIDSGVTIQPPAFNASTFIGGILAFKCNGNLTFNGGHIKTSDFGIPTTQKVLRPIQTQEQSGTGLLDVELWAGYENWRTRDNLYLNVGDGITFIAAKSITGHEDSRIGNPETYGVQFCRGASDSVGGKPSNATIIGGSTIFIACEDFTNFYPKMIAKYRNSNSQAGQGLARCYIASKNSTLQIDEGLYAFDIVSNPNKITKELNIRNFGNGSLGDVANPTAQLSNYARITAISSDGYRLTYTGKTTLGLAPITTGALVMIHSSRVVNDITADTAAKIGNFRIATVIADNGVTITLDRSVADILNPAAIQSQIISLPQFQNFTLSNEHKAIPIYSVNSGGGIFAIAVKGTCNLSEGKINVWGQSLSGRPYGQEGLKILGNAQDSLKLPLGSGNGSVFILANKIIMNGNTRIGGTYSGANFGGAGMQRSSSKYPENYAYATQSGYRGKDYQVKGGSPFYRAQGIRPGGLGNNGMNSAGTHAKGTTNAPYYSVQGAHIMLIADTIDGFNLAAISTGGASRPYVGYGGRLGTIYENNGGAGYGSGGIDGGYGASSGGFIGGGGGGDYDALSGGASTGFAFIYCNNFTNPNKNTLTI